MKTTLRATELQQPKRRKGRKSVVLKLRAGRELATLRAATAFLIKRHGDDLEYARCIQQLGWVLQSLRKAADGRSSKASDASQKGPWKDVGRECYKKKCEDPAVPKHKRVSEAYALFQHEWKGEHVTEDHFRAVVVPKKQKSKKSAKA